MPDLDDGESVEPVADKSPASPAAPPGQPRRSERVEGTAARFWEIARVGVEVIVRHGRVGSDGQSRPRSLADPEAAARHADRLIREKAARGYIET